MSQLQTHVEVATFLTIGSPGPGGTLASNGTGTVSGGWGPPSATPPTFVTLVLTYPNDTVYPFENNPANPNGSWSVPIPAGFLTPTAGLQNTPDPEDNVSSDFALLTAYLIDGSGNNLVAPTTISIHVV